MKKLTSFILVFISILSINAQESGFGEISYEKATNISGKQRMLSQRIAKVFLLKKAGATGTELNRELSSSMQLFKRNLSILESNSKKSSYKVKASVRKEKEQWELFETKLKSFDQPNVEEVMSLSNELLKRAHALVLAIEEESKYNKEFTNNNGNNQLQVEIVNISGKQRMLSQRLCLYYTACRLFKKDRKNSQNLCFEVNKIFKEMNTSLNTLLICDLNSFEIEENIGKVLSIFEEIEANEKDFFDNKLPLARITSITNNITSLYNIITGQYASL